MRNLFHFLGGHSGPWRVRRMTTLRGDALSHVPRLSVTADPGPAAWTLRGFTSNIRYADGAELHALRQVQPGLGRPAARHAALIPLRKTDAWWDLAQDERRAIFEEASHHTAIGLDYLPAVARRLHHSRDLGEGFDFLTWFEYAPAHEADFDALLARLRAQPEWHWVDREIDIRLERDDPA